AHASCQKNLADGIVDFVRAGVEQIFALEINLRAAEFFRESFRQIKWRGPPAEFAEVIFQLALKLRIVLSAEVLLLELLQGMHQRFRNVTAAIWTKMAFRIRNTGVSNGTHNSTQCQESLIKRQTNLRRDGAPRSAHPFKASSFDLRARVMKFLIFK